MFDIDVHIIIYKEPQWKIKRCLDSLKGQPVNIHIIKGEHERPPAKGRKKGFSVGSAMYQSLVDPDDVVRPGAFNKLLEHKGADLIYGKEILVLKNGKVMCDSPVIHHAYLVKRDAFTLEEKIPRCFITLEAARAKNMDIRFVDEILYEWHERGDEWI